MGRYRLQRGRLYFAMLKAVAGKEVHSMHEVPNVGHDHSMIWQSKEGLKAIFGGSSARKEVAALEADGNALRRGP